MLTGSTKKQKEDLEEISTELELADEDEKVPYEFQRIASALFMAYLRQVQSR